jgi:hypothetical protein
MWTSYNNIKESFLTFSFSLFAKERSSLPSLLYPSALPAPPNEFGQNSKSKIWSRLISSGRSVCELGEGFVEELVGEWIMGWNFGRVSWGVNFGWGIVGGLIEEVRWGLFFPPLGLLRRHTVASVTRWAGCRLNAATSLRRTIRTFSATW